MTDDQYSRRDVLKMLAAGALAASDLTTLSALANAQSAGEADPVEQSLARIRSYQLPNGAINMRTERNVPTDKPVSDIMKKRIAGDTAQAKENHEDPTNKTIDTIRVIPYFSHYAAMALLSAQTHGHKDIKNTQTVANWMNFCVRARDEKTGLVFDHEGSLSQKTFKSNHKTDAVDSCAAVFLLLADRYEQEIAKLPPRDQLEVEKSMKAANQELDKTYPPAVKPDGSADGSLLKQQMKDIIDNAKLCLATIESVDKADDGLTVAAKTYPVKFLMDNVEVYGGLMAGARFFDRVGEKDAAQKARDMAQKVGAGLKIFWKDDKHLFAWDKQGKSYFDTTLNVAYPDALAQLFANAWIENHPENWAQVKQKFGADDACTSAHWLMAAIGAKDPDIEKYRQSVLNDIKSFDNTTNCHVPGLSLLSLFEGRSWMPNITEPEKAASKERS